MPAGAAPFQASIQMPLKTGIENFNLPSSLGKIQESYFPETVGAKTPLVIHIQDAHANPSAQKSIRKILHYLQQHTDFKQLYLEGASQALDPNTYRIFEDEGANKILLGRLARAGEITGAERFVFETGIKAQGIEDSKMYAHNVRLFRNIAKREGQTQKELEKIRLSLKAKADHSFNPALREFFDFTIQNSFDHFSPDQIAAIGKYSKKHLKMDLHNPKHQFQYPMLTRLFYLKKIENELEKQKIPAQAQALRLEAWLKDQKISSHWAGFVRNLSGETQDIRSKLEKFYQEASDKGFRFQDYPDWSRQAGFWMLSQEIQPQELMGEYEKLETLLFKTLAKAKEEKKIIRQYRDFILLERLLTLQATREDWKKMTSPSVIASPLKLSFPHDFGGNLPLEPDPRQKLSGMTEEVKPLLPMTTKQSPKMMTEALSFYKTAQRREDYFVKHLKNGMRAAKDARAVLVTGGFHQPGMLGKLKKENIAYISILPAMRSVDLKADTRLYHRAMLESTSQVQSLLRLQSLQTMPDEERALVHPDYRLNILRQAMSGLSAKLRPASMLNDLENFAATPRSEARSAKDFTELLQRLDDLTAEITSRGLTIQNLQILHHRPDTLPESKPYYLEAIKTLSVELELKKKELAGIERKLNPQTAAEIADIEARMLEPSKGQGFEEIARQTVAWKDSNELEVVTVRFPGLDYATLFARLPTGLTHHLYSISRINNQIWMPFFNKSNKGFGIHIDKEILAGAQAFDDIADMAISPYGRHLAVASGQNLYIYTIDKRQDGERVLFLKQTIEMGKQIKHIAYAADGNALGIIWANGSFSIYPFETKVYNSMTNDIRWELADVNSFWHEYQHLAGDLVFSPDGHYVAVIHQDGKKWDVHHLQRFAHGRLSLVPVYSHTESSKVLQMSFSINGKHLEVITEDHQAVLYKVPAADSYPTLNELTEKRDALLKKMKKDADDFKQARAIREAGEAMRQQTMFRSEARSVVEYEADLSRIAELQQQIGEISGLVAGLRGLLKQNLIAEKDIPNTEKAIADLQQELTAKQKELTELQARMPEEVKSKPVPYKISSAKVSGLGPAVGETPLGGEVRSVAYSPDGQSILVGSYDYKFRLYNLKKDKSGKVTGLGPAVGATQVGGWVRSVAYSPDGQSILVGSDDDHKFRLYNLEKDGSGKVTGVGPAVGETPVGGWVRSVAYSPDGQSILLGSEDRKFRLYNLEKDGSAKVSGLGPAVGETQVGGWVRSVAYSPDGQSILVGSEDRKFRLYNLEKDGFGKVTGVGPAVGETQVGGVVWSVAYSPDGQSILVGSEDYKFRLYNLEKDESGKVTGLGPAVGETQVGGVVRSIAYSPDGQSILAGSEDRKFRLYNLEKDGFGKVTGLGPAVGKTRVGGVVWSVAYSPDGQSILVGSSDRKFRIYPLIFSDPKVRIEILPRLRSEARSVEEYEADLSRIAELQQRIGEISGLVAGLRGLLKQNLIAEKDIPSIKAKIEELDQELAEKQKELAELQAKIPDAAKAAKPVTASTLSSSTLGHVKGVGDVIGETEVGGQLRSTAISPDGKFILIGSDDDRKFRLYPLIKDADGNVTGVGEKVGETKVGGGVIRTAISPDGKFILIGSYDDHKFRLYPLIKDGDGNVTGVGKKVGETKVDGRVWSTAISPDGKFILIGSDDDRKFRLYPLIKDADGNVTGVGKKVGETKVGGGVIRTAISPDGKFIVVGSYDDHKFRLYPLIKDGDGNVTGVGKKVGETKVGGGVMSTAISPDGKFIVVGSDGDHKFRLYNLEKDESGKVTGLGPAVGETPVGGRVLSVAYSPDGQSILVGSDDDKFRLYNLEKDESGKVTGLGPAVGETPVGGSVLSVAYSPDGQSILVGSSDDRKFRIYPLIFEEAPAIVSAAPATIVTIDWNDPAVQAQTKAFIESFSQSFTMLHRKPPLPILDGEQRQDYDLRVAKALKSLMDSSGIERTEYERVLIPLTHPDLRSYLLEVFRSEVRASDWQGADAYPGIFQSRNRTGDLRFGMIQQEKFHEADALLGGSGERFFPSKPSTIFESFTDISDRQIGILQQNAVSGLSGSQQVEYQMNRDSQRTNAGLPAEHVGINGDQWEFGHDIKNGNTDPLMSQPKLRRIARSEVRMSDDRENLSPIVALQQQIGEISGWVAGLQGLLAGKAIAEEARPKAEEKIVELQQELAKKQQELAELEAILEETKLTKSPPATSAAPPSGKVMDVGAAIAITTYFDHSVDVLAYAPDGKSALAASGNRFALFNTQDVRAKRLGGFAPVPMDSLIAGHILSAAYSPNAKSIAIGSDIAGENFYILNLFKDAEGNVKDADDRIIRRGIGRPAKAIAFSPDGKAIAVGGDETRSWLIYNLKLDENGFVATDQVALEEMDQTKVAIEGKGARSIAFSPDGQSILIANAFNGGFELRNLIRDQDGKIIDARAVVDKAFQTEVNFVAYHPDGNSILIGRERKVQIYQLVRDKTTGRVINIAGQYFETAAGGKVRFVAYHPNGESILAGYEKPDKEKRFQLHNLEKDKDGRIAGFSSAVDETNMGINTAGVSAAAFSPDGKLLLAGYGDALRLHPLIFAGSRAEARSTDHPAYKDVAEYYKARGALLTSLVQGRAKVYETFLAATLASAKVVSSKIKSPDELREIVAHLRKSPGPDIDPKTIFEDLEILRAAGEEFDGPTKKRMAKEAAEFLEALGYEPEVREDLLRQIGQMTYPLTLENLLPRSIESVAYDAQSLQAVAHLLEHFLATETQGMRGAVIQSPASDKDYTIQILQQELRSMRATYLHEIIHYLALQNVLPFDGGNELITTAVSSVIQHDQEVMKDFLDLIPEENKSMRLVYEKIIELGRQHAKKSARLMSPQEIHQFAKTMLEKEVAEAATLPPHLLAEFADRLGGFYLGTYAWEIQGKKKSSAAALKYVVDYGKRYLPRVRNLTGTRKLTPRDWAYIDTILPTLQAVARVTLHDADSRLHFKARTLRDMRSADTNRWFYENDHQRMHYVPWDILQYGEDASVGLALQEIFRANYSDQGLIEEAFEKNTAFRLLYGIAETSRVVARGLAENQGRVAEIETFYRKKLRIFDLEIEKERMADQPKFVQYIEALFYVLALTQDAEHPAKDPRLTDPLVLKVVETTFKTILEVLGEEGPVFYETIRNKVWPEVQKLLEEDKKKMTQDEMAKEALNKMIEDGEFEVELGEEEEAAGMPGGTPPMPQAGEKMKIKLAPPAPGMKPDPLDLSEAAQEALQKKIDELMKDDKVRKEMERRAQKALQEKIKEEVGGMSDVTSEPQPAKPSSSKSRKKMSPGFSPPQTPQAPQSSSPKGKGGSGIQQEIKDLQSMAQEIQQAAENIQQQSQEASQGAAGVGSQAEKMDRSGGEPGQAGAQKVEESLDDLIDKLKSLRDKAGEFQEKTETIQDEVDDLASQPNAGRQSREVLDEMQDLGEELDELSREMSKEAADSDKAAAEAGESSKELSEKLGEKDAKVEGIKGRAKRIGEKMNDVQKKLEDLQERAEEAEKTAENLNSDAEELEKITEKPLPDVHEDEGDENIPGEAGGSGAFAAKRKGRKAPAKPLPDLKPRSGPKEAQHRFDNELAAQLAEFLEDVEDDDIVDPDALSRSQTKVIEDTTGLSEQQRIAIDNIRSVTRDYEATLRENILNMLQDNERSSRQTRLRKGRLDPRALPLVEAGVQNPFWLNLDPQKKKLRIGLLIDGSGSMQDSNKLNLGHVTEGMVKAQNRINNAVKVALLFMEIFRDDPRVELEIGVFASYQKIILPYGTPITDAVIYQTVFNILHHRLGEDNSDLAGLDMMLQSMRKRDNQEGPQPKILTIIADGGINYNDRRGIQGRLEKNTDIVILPVGIGPDSKSVKDAYAPLGQTVDDLSKLTTEIGDWIQVQLGRLLEGLGPLSMILIAIAMDWFMGGSGMLAAVILPVLLAPKKTETANFTAIEENGKKYLVVKGGKYPTFKFPINGEGSNIPAVDLLETETNVNDVVDILEGLQYQSLDKSTLLTEGEAGVGKNKKIYYAGKLARKNVRFMAVHEEIHEDDLVERQGVNEKETGKTDWIPSPLVEAMIHGDWVILDETNKLKPEVRKRLNQIIQSRRAHLHDGTLVVAKEGFAIIETGNPEPSGNDDKVYMVNRMSGESEDRIRRLIINYLPPHEEIQLLYSFLMERRGYKAASEIPQKEQEIIKNLVELANQNRSLYFGIDPATKRSMGRGQLIARPMSTRALVHIVKRLAEFPDEKDRMRALIARFYSYEWEDAKKKKNAEEQIHNKFPADKVYIFKGADLTGPRLRLDVTKDGKRFLDFAGVSLELGPKAPKNLEEVPLDMRVGWADENLEYLRNIMMDFKQGSHMLFIGEMGTGKSLIAEYVSYVFHGPTVETFGITNNTMAEDLIAALAIGHGRRKDVKGVIVEAGKHETGLVPGYVIRAMEAGRPVILDEYNAGKPEVMAVLNNILEYGWIDLANGERIHAKPGFLIIGTMNPRKTNLYLGTYRVSGEARDRFSTYITGYLKPESELKILQDYNRLLLAYDSTAFSMLSEEFLKRLVVLAGKIREAYAKGTLPRPVSPRGIKRIIITLAAHPEKYHEDLEKLVLNQGFFFRDQAHRETIKKFMKDVKLGELSVIVTDFGVEREPQTGLEGVDNTLRMLQQTIDPMTSGASLQFLISEIKKQLDKKAEWIKLDFEEKIRRAGILREIYQVLGVVLEKRVNKDPKKSHSKENLETMRKIRKDLKKELVENRKWPDSIFDGEEPRLAWMNERIKKLKDAAASLAKTGNPESDDFLAKMAVFGDVAGYVTKLLTEMTPGSQKARSEVRAKSDSHRTAVTEQIQALETTAKQHQVMINNLTKLSKQDGIAAAARRAMKSKAAEYKTALKPIETQLAALRKIQEKQSAKIDKKKNELSEMSSKKEPLPTNLRRITYRSTSDTKFSPDGRFTEHQKFGASSNHIYLHVLRKKKRGLVFEEQPQSLLNLSRSKEFTLQERDGKTFLMIVDENILRFWSIEPDAAHPNQFIFVEAGSHQFESDIKSWSFTPDSKYLAVLLKDGTLIRSEIGDSTDASGKEIYQLKKIEKIGQKNWWGNYHFKISDDGRFVVIIDFNPEEILYREGKDKKNMWKNVPISKKGFPDQKFIGISPANGLLFSEGRSVTTVFSLVTYSIKSKKISKSVRYELLKTSELEVESEVSIPASTTYFSRDGNFLILKDSDGEALHLFRRTPRTRKWEMLDSEKIEGKKIFFPSTNNQMWAIGDEGIDVYPFPLEKIFKPVAKTKKKSPAIKSSKMSAAEERDMATWRLLLGVEEVKRAELRRLQPQMTQVALFAAGMIFPAALPVPLQPAALTEIRHVAPQWFEEEKPFVPYVSVIENNNLINPMRLALVYNQLSDIPESQMEVLEDFVAHHPLAELQIAVKSAESEELRHFEASFRERVLKLRAQAALLSSPHDLGGDPRQKLSGMTVKSNKVSIVVTRDQLRFSKFVSHSQVRTLVFGNDETSLAQFQNQAGVESAERMLVHDDLPLQAEALKHASSILAALKSFQDSQFKASGVVSASSLLAQNLKIFAAVRQLLAKSA